MKLHAYLVNENKRVQISSHEKLEIILLHELEGLKWKEIEPKTNQVEVYFTYNNGIPEIMINMPETWHLKETANHKGQINLKFKAE